MRVPGFNALSRGSRIFMMLGDRYIVTTVALLRSASNRSPTMNETRLATPFSRCARSLDQPRIDLMPTALAPYFAAAMIGGARRSIEVVETLHHP